MVENEYCLMTWLEPVDVTNQNLDEVLQLGSDFVSVYVSDQENSYKPNGVGQSTLRYDGYTPSWDSPEYYAKRVIKRAINQLNQHL